MNSLGLSRYALSSCVAAALLAGCGGSQPPIGALGTMPQSRAIATRAARGGSWMLPAGKAGPVYQTGRPLLYVSDYTYNRVTIYHPNAKDPAPFATIIDGLNAPTGDCLDSQGTLYVANEPASNGGWVSEYPLGKTEPSKTITEGIDTPAFCAIDSKGNLWVTNIGGPNATEYLYGSTKPHTVITRGLSYPVGVAIDHSDNLYVSDRANSDVVVYAPGSTTPSRTITDGVTSPVGITIDANGVLYVENITERNVEEYLPGAYHPFKTIVLGLPTPSAITVNGKAWLYVANGAGIHHRVVEFPPGSVIPSERHVSRDVHAPAGVAYYPPLLP